MNPDYQFIADAMCGNNEDWMDAVEALGVRPMYYNGAHRAFLGRNKPQWTNATVAFFKTGQETKDWCDRVNALVEPD